MEVKTDYTVLDEKKNAYIDRLADELVILRAKANIPQEDLAKMVGISRQTYGDIERKNKSMSWGTYLALLFFFDHNKNTHQLLRQTGVFPEELISYINNGEQVADFDNVLSDFPLKKIIEGLDEQGLHAIRTLLMVEYARCKNIPGDVVIKSFDGNSFFKDITDDEREIEQMLKEIKEKRRNS